MSTGSAKVDVVTGVYNLLTGDTTYMNLVQAVLTSVKSGQDYPYSTLSDVRELTRDTLTYQGRNVYLTVHTYSRADNPKEAEDINSRLQELLHHRASLTIPNWNFVGSWMHADDMVLEEEEGDLYHGIAPYLIQVDNS